MFKKLFQIDPPKIRKHKGIDSELLRYKKLVNALGKNFIFESKPNQESIFNSDFQSRIKILGIDDKEDINRWLKVILEVEDYDYRYVDNVQDGLKLIYTENFDLVLLDISIRDFNVNDVVNTLEKDDTLKKQPVILFTASSITEEKTNKIKEHGIFKCLKKPVDIDTLLNLIARLPKKKQIYPKR